MTASTAPAKPTSALESDRRLDQYFANEEERRAVTRAMFDQAATGYDSAENLTALGRGSRYRREVLQRNGLADGMSVLDVAAENCEVDGAPMAWMEAYEPFAFICWEFAVDAVEIMTLTV